MSLRTLRAKFPEVPSETLEELYKWDPSGRTRKYVRWMVRRVSKGADSNKVLEAVQTFHMRRQRLKKDQRDLIKYKSLKELQGVINKLGPKSKRQKRKDLKGYTLIRDFPNVTLYRLDDYEGAATLGKDTRWCITCEETWEKNYKDTFFIIAVVKNKKRRDRFSKFAISFSTAFDIDDESLLTLDRMKKIAQEVADGVLSVEKGLSTISIFDELDDSTGGNGANGEILKLLIGEDALRETLTQALQEHTSVIGSSEFREVFTLLTQERSLKKGDFLRIVDLVTEHRFFDPLSLFNHPKTRVRSCAQYLWDRLPEGRFFNFYEMRVLSLTPAVSLPEFMSVYLEQMEDDLLHMTGTNQSVAMRKMFSRFQSNSHLSQETKEMVMNWYGRYLFQMENYETNFRGDS